MRWGEKKIDVRDIFYGFKFMTFRWGFFLASFIFISYGFYRLMPVKTNTLSNDIDVVSTVFDSLNIFAFRSYEEIMAGENLFLVLKRLNVANDIAQEFIKVIGRGINLKLLKPKDVIMVEWAYDDTVSVSGNRQNKTVKALELYNKDGSLASNRIRAEYDDNTKEIKLFYYRPEIIKEHALMGGSVDGTIYGSIINAGGDAQLVNSFADIFMWQFDFYKDTKMGDSYQMIVEKQFSEGRVLGFGRVLAAEYVSGNKALRGYYFESNDKQISGFFDDKGLSLKNAFLKAPLKLASISSKYGMRFHPIQKRMKPHNGVDYGAARGTPIMSVANGVVSQAGFSIYNGNYVKIRHANGYETEYLHANHLAKGIRVGANVKQGQIIGYVGKTGLASGYHLHFGMKQNGKYVNPSAQKFARSFSVPSKYISEYHQSIAALVIALNNQSKDKALALKRGG